MAVETRKRKYIKYFSFRLRSPISTINAMRTETEVNISGITWLDVHDNPVNKDNTRMRTRIIHEDIPWNSILNSLKIRNDTI